LALRYARRGTSARTRGRHAKQADDGNLARRAGHVRQRRPDNIVQVHLLELCEAAAETQPAPVAQAARTQRVLSRVQLRRRRAAPVWPHASAQPRLGGSLPVHRVVKEHVLVFVFFAVVQKFRR